MLRPIIYSAVIGIRTIHAVLQDPQLSETEDNSYWPLWL